MRVIVTSTTDRIQERVAELRDAGVDARGVAADLTDQRGVGAVLDAARRAFGEPSVLVNNAGMTSVSAADSRRRSTRSRSTSGRSRWSAISPPLCA